MMDVAARRLRLYADVRGRVQGVGFRFFAQGEALRLGLAGTVRNCADPRRVEIVAEGERAGLEQLVERLRQGPPGAYVEDVNVSWAPASGEFTTFTIRH
jgi:acylphosphatase